MLLLCHIFSIKTPIADETMVQTGIGGVLENEAGMGEGERKKKKKKYNPSYASPS
ncbi:MAG: hypothetical protein Q8P07_03085 [bacterium]|nr:hypothetical protein [bacterium]